MEVCNEYVTGYVARWFHSSKFPGQEALAPGSWASSYNNAFISNLGRGGCRKRRRVIPYVTGYVTAVGEGPVTYPMFWRAPVWR